MLSLPPTNHFANGSSHSSVFVNGSFQVTVSRAIFAQKASGSRFASSYSAAWAFAWAVNAGSGGKVRPSARRFSISGRWSTLTWPLLPGCACARRIVGWVRPFYAGAVGPPGSSGPVGIVRGRLGEQEDAGGRIDERDLVAAARVGRGRSWADHRASTSGGWTHDVEPLDRPDERSLRRNDVRSGIDRDGKLDGRWRAAGA